MSKFLKWFIPKQTREEVLEKLYFMTKDEYTAHRIINRFQHKAKCFQKKKSILNEEISYE